MCRMVKFVGIKCSHYLEVAIPLVLLVSVRPVWLPQGDHGQGLLWGWYWAVCAVQGWLDHGSKGLTPGGWEQCLHKAVWLRQALELFLFRGSPGSQSNLHWWGLQTLLRVVSWQAPVGSEASVRILSNWADSHPVPRLADYSCFSGSVFGGKKKKKRKAMGDGKGENP